MRSDVGRCGPCCRRAGSWPIPPPRPPEGRGQGQGGKRIASFFRDWWEIRLPPPYLNPLPRQLKPSYHASAAWLPKLSLPRVNSSRALAAWLPAALRNIRPACGHPCSRRARVVRSVCTTPGGEWQLNCPLLPIFAGNYFSPSQVLPTPSGFSFSRRLRFPHSQNAIRFSHSQDVIWFPLLETPPVFPLFKTPSVLQGQSVGSPAGS